MKQLPWCLRRTVPIGLPPWKEIKDAWKLPSEVARLAWMRGLETPEDLAWRLDPCWSRTLDPFLMSGMGLAVDRIRKAIEQQESICIYGDYDVDGVTATAVLVRTLERMGARVSYFIPNRFNDGYGLNAACIQDLAGKQTLMISVDCGIRSVEEVALSRELELEWIITDHHEPGEEVPQASAILHPARGEYPNHQLAGVGVAFKLAQALLDAVPTPSGKEAIFLDGLLKLVAIGTIADMVPLEGENALLVKRGLQSLGGVNGPGLSSLLTRARIEGIPTAQQLAFGIVPRLNAVGRMGGAEDAVRLLLTRDVQEAAILSEQVERLNEERREIQKTLVERLPAPDGAAFDLVMDAQAHKGVIGIVASRRVQESSLPTAVCTLLDGVIHCSMRAPEGYDLTELLDLAKPFLRSGGGHRSAAGMSFDPPRWPFIREALIRGAKVQSITLAPLALSLDGEGTDLIPSPGFLAQLEPFGPSFPEPLVRMTGRIAAPHKTFGAGHRKFRLANMDQDLVWFGGEDSAHPMKEGDSVDLAISPQDHPRWGRSWLIKAFLDSSGETS